MRPAFAAPDTSLKQYRDLFGAYLGNDPVIKGTPDAISRTQSGVFYIRTDRVSNGVTKLLFGANLMFPGLNDGAQYENTENQIWDYVGNNDGDANDSSGTTSSADDSFILRTYQIDTNGQKTNISYETDIYKIMQTGPNVPLNQMPLLSAPQTGQAKFYKWGYFKNANGAAQRVYLVNQKITIPVSYTTAVPYGATMGADLWYCGGRGAGVGNGDFSRGDDEITGWENNVEFFDGDPELCDGTAYWKIGPSITFTLPASAQAAIQENEAQAAAQAQQIANVGSARSGQEGAGDVLPQCSMSNGTFGSGSFVGCIAYLVYYLVYWPVAWFAGILGKLFDFFLGYSLSDASYRAQFAVRGWQIVRDLSNIFFIIILVYTGLMAVFGGGPNMKKVVPQLILNALLINFSLFGTRVIIDISNVVARVFYKSVEVCDGKCNSDMSNKKEGIAGYTPLSEKIVSAFNPQKIFSTDTLSAASALPDNGTSQQGSVNARVADRSTSEYAGYFIVVSLIAAFILFAIAMMFWKTAFFFVGRVIGLYICMIFAPFAFLTMGGMPLVSKIGELSWKKWSEDLVNYATLAPIFVFFLYVIYSFLETDFIKVYADKVGNSFFETVVYIAIPMIIVWYMIRQGVKIAEKYAGDAGKGVTKIMNTATGLVGGAALGVATGGVALAGRNILGRVGARVAGSGALQNASARGGIRGWLADRTMQVGSGMSRATYDARNTTAARNFQRATGTNLNGGINRLFGTGTNRTAGGFTGAISREVATETARAQRFQLTGQQAVVQDNLNRAWESAYQTARNTAQQNANAQGQVFDENNFRANYETQQAAAGNARPDTSAQINRRREQQNNARLTRGTVLARISRTVTNRFTAPTGAAGVAANALGATIAGNLGIAAATVVGQGAIENAAQQQVAQARAGAARAPLNPTQVANLQNRLTQLQNELTRRITLMNSIGGTFAPPISYANLTAANIIDYQTDRQNDINNLQQTIDLQQDFIDRNQNNPAQANAVNTARAMIRRLQNDQNTHRNNIRQAGTVLAEYTRIQNDIDAARTQLANN